jgi:RHS repeat-associated protein
MRVYKNVLMFTLILVSFSSYSYGDVSYTDPSITYFPEAKSGGTVDYKGDFRWSENIMTVPGRNGLSFDLNLSYKSGILVEQESSWVGLGWDLSIGCVARAVVNYPDEYDAGFFGQGEEVPLINDPMYPNRAYIPDSHDRFYLVLPNGGGQIILAEPCEQGIGVNGGQLNNIDIEFRCAGWNSWRIIAHTSSTSNPRYIEKFTVITDDGTTYIFDAICWSKASEHQSWVGNYMGILPKIEDVLYYFCSNPFEYEYEDWPSGYRKHKTFTGKAAPYSWGLTQILSTDYYDETGNGPSDDDKGSWVKITYEYPVGESIDGTPLEFLSRFLYYCEGDWYYGEQGLDEGEDVTASIDCDNPSILGKIDSENTLKEKETIVNAGDALIDSYEEPATVIEPGSAGVAIGPGLEGSGVESLKTKGGNLLLRHNLDANVVTVLGSIDDSADNSKTINTKFGVEDVDNAYRREHGVKVNELGQGEYYRRTHTRMTFAVPETIETPTHIAYFDTSEKELADCIATHEVGGIRHLYKLDQITLKSRLPDPDESVCSVDFEYYPSSPNPEENESLCYDVHPVTDGDFTLYRGGKLTLKSIKHYNCDRTDSLPGYYFCYTYYRDLLDALLHGMDGLGYGYDPQLGGEPENWMPVWNVSVIYFPTGGAIKIDYETDYANRWQNSPFEEPEGGIYCGCRVNKITTYTGVEPPYSDKHSEERVTYYEYHVDGAGIILDLPNFAGKDYCPASIMHRENYIAYRYVKSYSEIKDYWGADTEWPGSWPYTYPITRCYTTAEDYPDPAKITYEGDVVQICSYEWMRGHISKIIGPYSTTEFAFDFPTYEENNDAYLHPRNCPGLMDEYNPNYYNYDDGNLTIRVHYYPGWPRIAGKSSVTDGTKYGEEYDFDYYENHEYYKANGRPNEIRTYREMGGSALSAYRNNGGRMRETARGLAGSVVNTIYNNIAKGQTDENASESLFSIIRGKAGNILSGVINTLEGMELVTTTEITYAYEKGYESSPPDVYVQMGPDYKNMLSYRYQATTYDETNGHDKVSDTIMAYAEFGDYDQIHPSESKRWLKYGVSSRWVTSTFVGYDYYGNLIEVEDPLGRTTSSTYPVDYKYSVPTSITNAKGHTTSLNYDTRFVHITDITDPNDLTTYYEYDKFGRLTYIYYPNNPPSSGQPSVGYTYHWAPERFPGYPYGNNDPEDFCYIKTETLVEHGLPPEKRVSTEFYNGIGENFRTVVQTGDDYLDGLYSDTYRDASGKVVVSHIPYEADGWDDAILLPFTLTSNLDSNHKAHTGDPEPLYVPYYETIYDVRFFYAYPYKWGVTDRPMITFRPSKNPGGDGLNRLYAFESPNQLFGSAFRYDSEDVNGRALKTVLSIDGEKREVKDYYDERGNHLKRIENRGASLLEFTKSGSDGFITGINWFSSSTNPINTSYYYDTLNRLTEVIDARGFSHTFSYDSFRRMRETTDPDRGTTEYGYDDVGNLTVFVDAELDANECGVRYYYDELNRITEELVYAGLPPPTPEMFDNKPTLSADLDVFGVQVGLYNNAKNDLRHPWGSALPPDCGPKGDQVFMGYTAETKVEYYYDEVDPWNVLTGSKRFRSENNSVTAGGPVEPVVEIGKLLRVVDKIGRKDFNYDGMGRITKILDDRCYFDFEEYTHEYEYNIIGDLISETYPSGLEVSYEYDKAGRLINIPGFYGEGSGSASLDFENERTPLGSERYFGTYRSSIGERIYPSLLARKRTMEADPSYSFDMMCKGISPTLNQVLDGFIYDEDFNRLEHICPNNGANTKYYFDDRQAVYDVHYNIYEERPSGNPQLQYYYRYDDSLQVEDITDNLFENEISGEVYKRKRIFTYNAMNRLKETLAQWYEPSNTFDFYNVSYDYDDLGNREGINDIINSEYIDYDYANDSNRLLTDGVSYGYLYDDRGAITEKSLGDHSIQYDYDYAGRLIKISDNNGSTLSNTKDPGFNTKLMDKMTPPKMGVVSTNPGDHDPLNNNTSVSGPVTGCQEKGPISERLTAGDPGSLLDVWEFTYDGGGARIFKEGPDSASKYMYDATGRLITEVSNDFKKSSANRVKNAGFEVYEFSTTPGPGCGTEYDLEGGSGEITKEFLVTDGGTDSSKFSESEAVSKAEMTDESEPEDPLTDLDAYEFAEWIKADIGGDIGPYFYSENYERGPEGNVGVEIDRTSSIGELMLYQKLDIISNRTYELRFWAKQEGLGDGGACVKVAVSSGEANSLSAPVDATASPIIEPAEGILERDIISGQGPIYDKLLRSEDITAEDWTEYRMAFAVGTDYEDVFVILEVEGDDLGSVYFDRVTVSEYLNDLANPSFENLESIQPPGGADFEDWNEVREVPEQITRGDGIVSANCAELHWPGGNIHHDIFVEQTGCLLPAETHEISFYAKTTGNGVYIYVDALWGIINSYEIFRTPESESIDTWTRFTFYYTTPDPGEGFPPLPSERGIRIGVYGGMSTRTVYIDDVTCKTVPDMTVNGDMESYYLVSPDVYDFVGWEEEIPEDADLEPETVDPYMNNASAKFERDEGSGYQSLPVTLFQEFPCLPGTEYEITVAYKMDPGFEQPQGAFYGAFCLVGDEIISPFTSLPPTEYLEYEGEFIEVVNESGSGVAWYEAKANYKVSGDKLQVLLGMGQGCEGECWFDSVIIRDLTTKRYEYIYGKGRRLAKVEYEGDVLEAQVYYYHNDLLGSTICVTDIDGNVAWKGDYLPFGEPLQDIDTVYWGNAYTYLGNEDDGGLMYFNARYYAKELGRFMSCDPIKDMASSALTINPYVYCGNNPIAFKDSFGLSVEVEEGPPEGSELDEGFDGYPTGFWDEIMIGMIGFDTPGGLPGTGSGPGHEEYSASGGVMENSFIQILLYVISATGIANETLLYLVNEGYTVDIAGYGITSNIGERGGSLSQQTFHDELNQMSEIYESMVILGHNAEGGKIFSNYTRKFDKKLAENQTLPVKQGGSVAIDICQGGEDVNISGFRNWITRSKEKGGAGIDKNRFWSCDKCVVHPLRARDVRRVETGEGPNDYYTRELIGPLRSRENWHSTFVDLMDFIDEQLNY